MKNSGRGGHTSMMSSRAACLLLVCAAPGAALASGPCEAVRFIEPVRDEVRDAVATACGGLTEGRTDTTVSIEIRQASEAAGGLISILATGEDGREAFRSVSTPEAAGTSVLALLLVPAREKSLVASPLPAATRPPSAPALSLAPTTPTVDVVSGAGPRDAVTLGGNVFAATHIGFGEGSALGAGVSGTVDVTLEESWQLGAHARVEPATFNLDREQIGGTFGGGPEAAYRISMGEAGLMDLGVGADFLATVPSYERPAESVGEPDAEGEGEGEARDRHDERVMLDVRARVFGRFTFPTPLVSLALLAGIDVSPVAIADGHRGRDENVLAPVGLELGIGIGFRSDDLAGGAP